MSTDFGQLLEQLQQSGSPRERCPAWRRVLCQAVNQTLTDTNKVVKDLTQKLKNSSPKEEYPEYDMALQFVTHCITVCSQCFVIGPASSGDDTPTLSQVHSYMESEEENRCYATTCWLITRLLRIVAHPKCQPIHKKTLSVLLVLVRTVKMKDPYMFSRLLSEFIMCLKDMTCMSENFYKEGGSEYVAEVQQFHVVSGVSPPTARGRSSLGSGETTEVTLTHIPITLKDPESCESLQTAVSTLLAGLGIDVCRCSSCQLHDVLWGTLCSQLEYGELELKKASLALSHKLLVWGDLPTEEVVDYYLNCLVALVHLIASGTRQVEGDYIGLETSLAGSLDMLSRYLNKAHQTRTIGPYQIQTQLLELSRTITEYGMAQVQTAILKQAVSSLLVKLQRGLPGGEVTSGILGGQMEQLTRAMVAELGTSEDAQHWVRCLHQSAMLDMLKTQTSGSQVDAGNVSPYSNGAPPENLSSEESEKEGRPEKKRRLGQESKASAAAKCQARARLESTESVKMAEKSLTVKLLHGRLKELMEQFQNTQATDKTGYDYVGLLEGIRVIIEVLVWCVVVAIPSQDWSRPQQTAASTQSSSVLTTPDLGQWLSQSQVLELCDLWKAFLQQCVAEESLIGAVPSCYARMVKITGSLVSVHEFSSFTPVVYTNFTWLLSLTWLVNDMSWLDLKPKDSKGIAKFSSAIVDSEHCKIYPETLSESVQILAMFPKEATPQWRTKVLSAAMSDSDPVVRKGAVCGFPYLLYYGGPNTNYLVRDQLHGCLEDRDDSVLEELSRAVGPLTCVISRKAIIDRPTEVPSNTLTYKSVTIKCVSCDGIPAGDSPSSPHERPRLVDPAMFKPFLHLLQHSSTQIKMCMLGNLGHVFGHIEVRANNSATIQMLKDCLTLMEDPEYSVRMAFSKVIRHLVGDSSGDQCSQADKAIVEVISEMDSRLHKKNFKVQETHLLTVGQLGSVAEGELLLVVVLTLIKNICCPPSLLAAGVAHTQLKQVAQSKKMKMNAVLKIYRQSVCKFLVKTMYEAQASESDTAPLDILQEVADAFDIYDVKVFLQSTQQYILPYLVYKATPEASALIRMMARQLGYHYRKLLVKNVKFIFSHLVCVAHDSETLQKSLSYLQAETGLKVERVLKTDVQGIVNELLLRLSTHYNQVFRGLNILYQFGENKEEHDLQTKEDLANYLQPMLLGTLVFFDNQLLNAGVPLHDKKQTLESVISIMELMGPRHITAVRVRIMTTLRNGLQFQEKGFLELSCRAWNRFVHSVEMPSLGPMLSQIIVNLLPLLRQMPKQVAEIFSYLIVDNRRALSEHFHELYFMPDIPELADVNAILKNSDGNLKNMMLSSQLENLWKGIKHESTDVRLHALSKLKKLLHSNQVAVHQLVLGSETADTIISQLVSALFWSCRESDPALRILCGECLGELGAIDPGRLELMVHSPGEGLSKFQANVEDENFKVDLINELVRAFLRAEDTRGQDCGAFAMQEIMKIYKITNTPDCKIWRRLSADTQEILAPLLHTWYKLLFEWEWSNLKMPIYRSRKGNKFEDWVCTTTGYLASKTKDQARQVFESCRGVIKHDSHTALYLLPHVVVQALQDSTDGDRKEILTEMLAVLNHVGKCETRAGSASDFSHMSAQTVFSILDHLTKWTRHRVMTQTAAASNPLFRTTRSSSDYNAADDKSFQCIKTFLDKIPQDTLVQASFNCNAYTRALMHCEQLIKANRENAQKHLDFLQKLYLAMDEPDGVAGVTAIKQDQPTLSEHILAHESMGELADASVCYEQAIQRAPQELSPRQGLLRCFMDLGQLSTSMDLATGSIANKPAWAKSLNAYRVEAAWKLGQWDNLQTYLKEEQSDNWNIGLGKILLAVKDRNEEEFSKQLDIVRTALMGPLSAASMEGGSYQRGYEYIVRLHMLGELEQGIKTLLNFPLTRTTNGDSMQSDLDLDLDTLLQLWNSRLLLAQSSFRVQEPVINLRRTVLGLVKAEENSQLYKEIGKSWVLTAKVARKARHLPTAYTSLLAAATYNLPEVCVEKAKWLWEKGNHDQAQTCLERAIEENYPDRAKLKADNSEAGKAARLSCGRALLLLGRYQEETASLESNAIVRQYKEVMDVLPKWEDGYFYCAKYYDKIMTNLMETDRLEKRGEFVIRVVQNFGNSLLYGSQYIYQSMPRMLTLWLDYGAQLVEEEKKGRNETLLTSMRTILNSLNRTMHQFSQKLAPYQFLTAFPQLISRICHAQKDVFAQLLEIIARLLEVFPQQSVWMMMAVSKSSYQVRVQRCLQIFAKAKSLDPKLNKFLLDATKLTDRLLDLCNRPVEGNLATLSISQHFKPLQRLVDDRSFSRILLPLQSLMTVTLPTATSTGTALQHEPFPGKEVYIRGFEDMVEVLPSLQKPKKITMQGSDGKLYIMLCKPKDDLRKDARLMEFNGIVNKLLRKDPESRRRDLHIRTYTVTPLNEECGLLEWVPNTSGLRHILMRLYKERGLYTSGKELRAMQLPAQASLQKKIETYRLKLLPRHPPVFSEWFLKTFPDPTSWYNARLAYCRTTAVMSMVGYILGLGDRHGENILLDSTNGDCVHVDFNCLFNKGEMLEYPEVVPFRLTHNMVEAMGPTGFEGIFRRACEVTLRVMRDQQDPLMSVLKPFIYDPLVEWSKPARGRSNPTETGEIKHEKAIPAVNNIESRLKGILKNKTKARGLPLSVEGHVNHLIQEATDEKLLAQMYIGWAPYL